MKVSIIKYNAGNIKSVDFALKRLGIEPVITDDEQILKSSDRVIFPGVGEASSAMKYLQDRGLDRVIRGIEKPLLGICLGMQLLCSGSEENNSKGIGIFNTKIRKFEAKEKVPHMGWNNIFKLNSPLYKGINENSFVYFVHSFYAEVNENTIATCDYINEFSASLNKDNFYGCQFHPEKSGDIGEEILRNFLEI